MEQRDYLMKQVEQFGKVLGVLIFFKDNGKLSIEVVNQTFKEELDFDIDELISLCEDDLIDFLEDEKQINVKNLEQMADILSFVAENANSKLCDKFYFMILKIYKHLEELESAYSFDRNVKIAKIKKMIDTNTI